MARKFKNKAWIPLNMINYPITQHRCPLLTTHNYIVLEQLRLTCISRIVTTTISTTNEVSHCSASIDSFDRSNKHQRKKQRRNPPVMGCYLKET